MESQFDALTDDESRAAFLALVRTMGGMKNMPTFAELAASAKRGAEGVLDSALHLPSDEYERLEEIVKSVESKKPKSWRRSRS